MGMKDEDMEGLSDEERAALEDDDEDSEIIGKIAGDAGDDEDDEDDESDDAADQNDDDDSSESDSDESAAAGDDAGDDGKQAGAKDDGAVNGDETAAADDVPEFRPEFKADRPEGLTEKLAELETQTKSLLAKFKDGDIDMPEFMAQKEAIDDEKLKLTLADAQAQWAEKQNTESRDQRWKWEQERFFGQEKAAIYKDPIILAALDASVKQIAADPANAKKPAGFFLEEADRQIRKRFNMGGESNTQTPTPKPKPRQPDLSSVPKTLGQLPAAEMAETGDVEFAYLDKLEGIALEAALRKLTPEQEARYLGAAV